MDWIQRTIVGVPGKIRFEGEVYRFQPTENCLPVWPIPFKVWVMGAPTDVGHYMVERLMCYTEPRSDGRYWVGYADRIKGKGSNYK